VVVTTLTALDPLALAAAYEGRARSEATFCPAKQALGWVTRRQWQWEAPQMGALVDPFRPSSAPGGQTVAQAGPGHPATVAGRWVGTVAPGRLGGARRPQVATRVDGPCALLPPSPVSNPASGELFRAVARACPGGGVALKTGSCGPPAPGCAGGVAAIRPTEVAIQQHPLQYLVLELCGRGQAVEVRLELRPTEAVYLQDSSTIVLPAALATVWQGCGSCIPMPGKPDAYSRYERRRVL
jgi:hypothetical protein